MFLALGWWAVRNVAIAVAVTIPIVGRACRPTREPDAAPLDREARYGTATPLLVVLVVLAWRRALVARAAVQPDFNLKRYPVVGDALTRHGAPARRTGCSRPTRGPAT